LTEWTDDEIYRAAYLALFDDEEREVLRRAGVVVAVQAISGKVADRAFTVGDLEVPVEDLLMAARHLRYISEKRIGSFLIDAQNQLCRGAEP
jgi:hypothetical protein